MDFDMVEKLVTLFLRVFLTLVKVFSGSKPDEPDEDEV